MTRLPRRLALAALAASALVVCAPPARAQVEGPKPKPKPSAPAAAPDRLRVVLNFGFWPLTTSFSDSRKLTEYAEQTTIETSYEAAAGFGPDLALQASFFRGLGVLVGYSRVSRDVTGQIEVSRPHPLYLGQNRSASAELSGYALTESAFHLDVAYARVAGHLDWALFAGMTMFKVQGDLLDKPTYDDKYPYDELAITGTPSVSVEDSPLGFNVGGRLDYRFGRSRRFGAGVQVLYSTASVVLRANEDVTSDATFDAGGLQVGAGVRVYF
jgi:hypothetical protein